MRPSTNLVGHGVLLRRAQDPVAVKLGVAPHEDDELTDEDLRAVKEARSEPGVYFAEAALNVEPTWPY